MSFRDSIPIPALLIVVTAVRDFPQVYSRALISFQIKAALEEYTTGVFVSTKFDADQYSKVYSYMMVNLDAVLLHDYHGPRVTSTIERWARTFR